MAPSSKSKLKVVFAKEKLPTNVSSVRPKNNFFEKGSGDHEDIDLVIDGGEYTLNRKAIVQTLEDLKKDADKLVNDLSDNARVMLNSVLDLVNQLRSTDYIKYVYEDIHKVFADITNFKAGTVASYFMDRSVDPKFMGPKECDPKAVTSLLKNDGDCSDRVLLYSDDKFTVLNAKKSSHAYIYIATQIFFGFTEENLAELKAERITAATIILTNSDGHYKAVSNKIETADLPKRIAPAVPTGSGSGMKATDTSGSTTSTNVNTALIVVVIILLIILIALFVLYVRRNHANDYE